MASIRLEDEGVDFHTIHKKSHDIVYRAYNRLYIFICLLRKLAEDVNAAEWRDGVLTVRMHGNQSPLR
jgi:hypothetical protein